MGLLVYWPAFGNGFVWDDTALAQRDPLIRSWRLIPEGFGHYLFVDATGSNFYRPIQRLTFTLDYALWGLGNPGGWHITSVLVHIGAALALYALLLQWWGGARRWWAVGVATLWVLHPIHTSAVTYVAGRADSLAALFGFGALALALRGRTLLAATCFLGAMLSKESGAMAMAVWLVFLAWKRADRATWLRWLAVAALVFGIYASLRWTARKTPPPAGAVPAASQRGVLAARAVAEYAGLLAAPVHLRMERDVAGSESWRRWQTAGGVAILLAGAGWLAWSVRRSREAALALCAAGVAYLPISNLIPLNASVAEHWLYVPSAFFFAAVAASLWHLRRSVPVMALGAAGAVWCAWLGVRSWQRQGDWKDQRTFILATIAAGGDSARMRVNLGNELLAAGKIDEALASYAAALERRPGLSFAHLGVAGAELRRKNFAAARAAISEGRKSDPENAQLGEMLTAIDFAEHKKDPAPGYSAAADRAPLNWPLRRRAVVALAATDRLDAAIAELARFLEDQDFRADSWKLMAELQARAGKADQAAIAMYRARRLDCRFAE